MSSPADNACQALAANVRRERIRRGWTQEQLSERSGVAARWIQKIESGRHNPSFAIVVKVIVALELSLAAALDPTEMPERRVGRPPKRFEGAAVDAAAHGRAPVSGARSRARPPEATGSRSPGKPVAATASRRRMGTLEAPTATRSEAQAATRFEGRTTTGSESQTAKQAESQTAKRAETKAAKSLAARAGKRQKQAKEPGPASGSTVGSTGRRR